MRLTLRATSGASNEFLYKHVRLLWLSDRKRTFPRGRTHESLSESRMREICTSGSMSGGWKRSFGYRATSRLYPGFSLGRQVSDTADGRD